MERMLRVSVYREGCIVDDRFVPPDGLLAGAKAVVQLPHGRIPEGHRLFVQRRGKPVLSVPPRVAGQVALDGRHAEPLSPGEVELGPDAKGWLDLGEAKVFFQVTGKPAPVPRSALPKDVRSRLSALDRRYAVALFLAIACEGVALWQVARQPAPLEVAGSPIDAAPGWQPIPKVPAPPPPPKPEVAAKPGKPGKPSRPGEPVEHVEAKSAKAIDREAIRRSPIFAVIASATGATKEVLSTGTPTALAEAFDHLAPVNRPVPEVGPAHKGTQGTEGPQEIGTPGVDVHSHEVLLTDKAPAKLPDVRIEWGDPEDPPPVDDPGLASRIAAEIRARRGAIQHCYERELKLRPGLHGKVVLAFTLGASGKVEEVAVEDESLHSPDTGACIETLARGWRLQATPPEAVPVRFPIVFSAAN